MRYPTRLPGPALLVLVLTVFATAGTAAPPASRPADPRLSAHVDLSVTRVPLAKAVESLGVEAEVPLECGAGTVARRPLMLFARDQTLGAIMRQLATFPATAPNGCAWTKATIGGRAGYRLVESGADQDARAILLRRLREERAARMRQDLDFLLRQDRLSPDDLAALREREPGWGLFAPGAATYQRILEGIGPEKLARLLAGETFSLPYAEMPADEQQNVRRMVGKRGMHLSNEFHPEIDFWWITDRDLPHSALTVRWSGRPDRPGIRISVPTLPGGQIGLLDVLHHPLPDRYDDPPEWLHQAMERRAEDRRKRLETLAKRYRGDAALTRKISLTAMVTAPDPANPGKTFRRYSGLSDALRQVADRSGLSVIGDYDPYWDDYYSWRDPHQPGQKFTPRLMENLPEMPVWRVLEELAEKFQVTWEKDGGFLRIRSPREPYAEIDGIDLLDIRTAPPPKEYLDALKAAGDAPPDHAPSRSD